MARELDNDFSFVLGMVGAAVLVAIGVVVLALGMRDRGYRSDTMFAVCLGFTGALPALALLPITLMAHLAQDGGVFWGIGTWLFLLSFPMAVVGLVGFGLVVAWTVATWRGTLRRGGETGWAVAALAMALLSVGNVLVFAFE